VTDRDRALTVYLAGPGDICLEAHCTASPVTARHAIPGGIVTAPVRVGALLADRALAGFHDS